MFLLQMILFFKCLMSSNFKTLAYQLIGGGKGRKKEPQEDLGNAIEGDGERSKGGKV